MAWRFYAAIGMAFLINHWHAIILSETGGGSRNRCPRRITVHGSVYTRVWVFSRWKVPFSVTLHLRVVAIACGV